MRVAYQAGAIRALAEHGYRFHHIDGSSGGIMNAAMVLSGIDSQGMIQRWGALDVRAFASLMPFRTWLAPLSMPALSSTDGIREKIFPHLGIDISTINRERTIVGTFNVANFQEDRRGNPERSGDTQPPSCRRIASCSYACYQDW